MIPIFLRLCMFFYFVLSYSLICSYHDKWMLFEQHHWKKARAKKQPYEFKVSHFTPKNWIIICFSDIFLQQVFVWFLFLLISGIRYQRKSGTRTITTGLSTSPRWKPPPCNLLVCHMTDQRRKRTLLLSLSSFCTSVGFQVSFELITQLFSA